MIRSIKDLQGFVIQATDGNIGKADEYYFDDDAWTIRYLVVNTGNWLQDRSVLISPISVTRIDWQWHHIDVSLTCDQVRNSPDIDTHKPIYRQKEIAFHRYFGYPIYWGGVGLWGGGMYPGLLINNPPEGTAPRATEQQAGSLTGETAGQAGDTEAEDIHLRGTREVIGYRIHARDGEIGHVEDFIINDQTWRIDYLVIDTSNWFGGKKVIIAPTWVRAVDWADEQVSVDLERETIKNSPEFNPETLTERPKTK